MQLDAQLLDKTKSAMMKLDVSEEVYLLSQADDAAAVVAAASLLEKNNEMCSVLKLPLIKTAALVGSLHENCSNAIADAAAVVPLTVAVGAAFAAFACPATTSLTPWPTPT